MYTVPAGGPWWHAVGPPLERVVRRHAMPEPLTRRPRLTPNLLAKAAFALPLVFAFEAAAHSDSVC
jgi:hypothetical protein